MEILWSKGRGGTDIGDTLEERQRRYKYWRHPGVKAEEVQVLETLWSKGRGGTDIGDTLE